MTHTNFRWEQDGAGGEHGIATYFVGTHQEISLRIDTFAEAHALDSAIAAMLQKARRVARRALLEDIGRIEP